MPQLRARGSVLATCSWVRGPVVRGTQRFLWLSSQLPHEWNSLASETSSREKHLANFSNLLAWSVLAGDPGNWLATCISREKHVFCVSKTIFKTFSVFPSNFCDCSLSSPFLSLKHSVSHFKNHSFLHHFFSNPQEKGMGFLYHTSFFMFWVCFLDSVSVFLPLCFEKYHARSRVCFILVSVLWLRVSVFDFITAVYLKSVLCFMNVLFHSYHVCGILSHYLSFESLWCSVPTWFWVITVHHHIRLPIPLIMSVLFMISWF